MTNGELRLVHLHIPKTAGTALKTAFEKQFKDRLRIFPHWHEGKYTGVNPGDFDFYSGHFGFDTASRLQGDIVTVFRSPVDRFVSVYYFWRQLYERGVEKTKNTELAYKFKLDEFVKIKDDPGLVEEFLNRCTLQVAYGSSTEQRRTLRLRGLTDDEIFRMAVANLEKFSVIGIQEKMGPFADKIAEKFGVNLKIEKINVTEERLKIADISVSTRRAIQEWVFMDIELYQQAWQML